MCFFVRNAVDKMAASKRFIRLRKKGTFPLQSMTDASSRRMHRNQEQKKQKQKTPRNEMDGEDDNATFFYTVNKETEQAVCWQYWCVAVRREIHHFNATERIFQCISVFCSCLLCSMCLPMLLCVLHSKPFGMEDSWVGFLSYLWTCKCTHTHTHRTHFDKVKSHPCNSSQKLNIKLSSALLWNWITSW